MKSLKIIIVGLALMVASGVGWAKEAEVPFYGAQKVKPNVLIILDTSGSMDWDLNCSSSCCGGWHSSEPCCYETDPPSCRMDIARRVLTGTGALPIQTSSSGNQVYLPLVEGTWSVRKNLENQGAFVQIVRVREESGQYYVDESGEYFVFRIAADDEVDNPDVTAATYYFSRILSENNASFVELVAPDTFIENDGLPSFLPEAFRDIYKPASTGTQENSFHDKFIENYRGGIQDEYIIRVIQHENCYEKCDWVWVGPRWWDWDYVCEWHDCYEPDPNGQYFVFMDYKDVQAIGNGNNDLYTASMLLSNFLASIQIGSTVGTDSYMSHDNAHVCSDGWSGAAGCPSDGREEAREIYKAVPTGTAGAEVFVFSLTEQEIIDNIIAAIPYVDNVDDYAPGDFDPEYTPVGGEFIKTGSEVRMDIQVRLGLGISPEDQTISLDDPNFGGFFDNPDIGCYGDCLRYDALANEQLGIMDIYTDVRYGLMVFETSGDGDFTRNDPSQGGYMLHNLGDDNETIQETITGNETDPGKHGASTPIALALRDAYTYFYAHWFPDDYPEAGESHWDTNYNTRVDMFGHWEAEDWENSEDEFPDNKYGHIVQADPYYYYNCRDNYIIFVTDGGDNIPSRSSLEDRKQREQFYLEMIKEIPVVDPLGIKTFFIGFALDPDANPEYIELLEWMADQTDTVWNLDPEEVTDPLYANNEEQLRSSLATIMNIIMAGTYTRSAPKQTEEGLCAAYYEVGKSDYLWRGHLIGLPGYQNPEGLEGSTTISLDSDSIVDAAELLNVRDHTDRDIFTAILHGNSCEKIDFDPSDNITFSPILDPKDIDHDGEFWDRSGPNGQEDLADTQGLIYFVRGADGALFADNNTERTWRLGAINRSTPVIVQRPYSEQLAEISPSYQAFSNFYSNRPEVLYVGANDGMFHAFYFQDPDGDGPRSFLEEAWAYIPPVFGDGDTVAYLKNLNYLWEGTQWWYVDATPCIADLIVDVPDSEIPTDEDEAIAMGCITGEGSCWKTYALSGLGKGGRAYFTVDVTEADTITTKAYGPDDPEFWAIPRWIFTDPGLGETWSTPIMSVLKYEESDGTPSARVGAIFGGGWDTEGTDEYRVGSYLYVINMDDGTILKRFLIPDINEDPTGTPYPNPVYDNLNKLPGDPAVVDRDNDGYSETVYIGDIQGRVWKAVMNDYDPAEWDVCLFYDTGDLDGDGAEAFVGESGPVDATRRPVFYKPTVSEGSDPDELLVFFGTGHIEESTEALSETVVNRMFAVKDSDTIGGCSYGTLWEGDREGPNWPGGWWSTGDIDSTERLQGTGYPITFELGEKLIAPPMIREGGELFFFTFSPVERDNVCAPGSVFFWNVYYLTGEGLLNPGGEESVRVSQKGSSTGLYTIDDLGRVVTFNPEEGWGVGPKPASSFKNILSWGEGLDFDL